MMRSLILDGCLGTSAEFGRLDRLGAAARNEAALTWRRNWRRWGTCGLSSLDNGGKKICVIPANAVNPDPRRKPLDSRLRRMTQVEEGSNRLNPLFQGRFGVTQTSHSCDVCDQSLDFHSTPEP